MRLSAAACALLNCRQPQGPVTKPRQSAAQSPTQGGGFSGGASAYAGARPLSEAAGERALQDWATAGVLADAQVRSTCVV